MTSNKFIRDELKNYKELGLISGFDKSGISLARDTTDAVDKLVA